MSKFRVKRSLKQLYTEKHAMETYIALRKSAFALGEPTVRQMADLQSEEALLNNILNDIELAEEIIKREKAEM